MPVGGGRHRRVCTVVISAYLSNSLALVGSLIHISILRSELHPCLELLRLCGVCQLKLDCLHLNSVSLLNFYFFRTLENCILMLSVFYAFPS